MAKSNNTLLYTALGAAALLLAKKKSSGVAGIGELTPKHDMVYVLVKNRKYHDGWRYKIINVYQTMAKAKEAMRDLIEFDYMLVDPRKQDNFSVSSIITSRRNLDSFDQDSFVVAYAEVEDRSTGNLEAQYKIERHYLIG